TSYLCAKAAALAAEVTGGRLILGLGVSHQPVNMALGIDMPDPAAALRRYAVEVASWLRGEGPATHLPQQPSPYPGPVYLEALSDRVLDAICLIGPVARCRERLAAYREAGLDLPILWPAMGVEAAREVIAAFRQ